MVRKLFLIIALIIAILIIANYGLVVYGIKQGIDQLKITWGARDIEEVLSDPQVPDSVKNKLNLIGEVLDFGISEIGLKDNGNYRTYYDQKGEHLLFVVTAAQPFALEPYEWKFPILGKMPYKGFFDAQDAEAEKARLLEEGYDASIRHPGGWSTLGWFQDPVLSNMLLRNEGDIANVILHELTHGTVFVKDSVEYNENLATFIGDEAAERFLIQRFGMESEEWRIYWEENEDFDKYAKHILRGADKLDSLYKHIDNYPVEEKRSLKEHVIQEVLRNLDTIEFNNPKRYTWSRELLPNNSYFMSFLRYRANQDKLKDELEEEYNGNLKLYVDYLSGKFE